MSESVLQKQLNKISNDSLHLRALFSPCSLVKMDEIWKKGGGIHLCPFLGFQDFICAVWNIFAWSFFLLLFFNFAYFDDFKLCTTFKQKHKVHTVLSTLNELFTWKKNGSNLKINVPLFNTRFGHLFENKVPYNLDTTWPLFF